MGELFVKPVAGRVVVDPVTGKALAAHGEKKPDNTFWRRRLKAGAVVELKPAGASPASAPAEPAAPASSSSAKGTAKAVKGETR